MEDCGGGDGVKFGVEVNRGGSQVTGVDVETGDDEAEEGSVLQCESKNFSLLCTTLCALLRENVDRGA